MRRIEQFLRRETGLDVTTIGAAAFERTVQLRMKSHGLSQTADYFQQLKASKTELDALIEATVITETWFFRDQEPFRVLAQLAHETWLPQYPHGLCRILSLPCASGEEPYSIGMALLDADFPAARFQIEAVDISPAALRRAARAHYSKNSFRGKELGFRDTHFTLTPEGFQLNPNVQRQVRFTQHNLLAEDFRHGRPPYDFIFCRNLLIYFDPAAQQKAIDRLQELLTAEGTLFVGPAEMPLVTNNGFHSLNLPHAFACRKAPGPVTKTSPHRRPMSQLNLQPATPPPQPAADLLRAQELANTGELTAAAELCQQHLSRHHDSAAAYYLLGLIYDAGHDPAALDYYRKAIYLEPDHYEAIVHAALLLERRGDQARADAFKRWAERLQRQIPVA